MYQSKLTAITPLLVICIGLSGSTGWALQSDKDQPMELEADSADIDESKGVSIYTGNVVVVQGSINLRADRVTVYQHGSKPTRIIAEGQPVKFRQLQNDREQYVKGVARKADYLIASEELVLIGDAVLTQGKDSFESDRIVYDRVRAKVKAGAAAQGKERVKLTIGAKPDQ